MNVRFYLSHDIKNHIFGMKTSRILPSFTQYYNGRHICKPLVVYQIYCMALFHSQTRRHVINAFLSGLKFNVGSHSWKVTKCLSE